MKIILYTLFFLTLFTASLKSQTPDNSFNSDGKTIVGGYSEYEEVSSAFLQPDNKIVFGGYDYDETFYYPSMSVWRILPNGSPDLKFGTNGRVRISGSPYGGSEYGGYVALQPDNKIVGAGTDFDRDGMYKGRIVLFRLKPNGTFDSTFGSNGKAYANTGGFTNVVKTMLLKPDGKIVVGGTLFLKNSKTAELVQFLPDGRLDSSFGKDGILAVQDVYKETQALTLSSDNKIIAAFKYDQNGKSKTGLVKYNNDGTVDKTFGIRGGVSNNGNAVDSYTKIALSIQADGKILEYTSNSSYESPSSQNTIYKYNANGTIDQSFGTNGFVHAPQTNYTSISVVSDNNKRILVNTPDFGILRYLETGKLDSSFGYNGKVSIDYRDSISNSDVRSEQILIQPDTKIIGIGYFDSYDGLQEFMLARFKNVDKIKTSSAPVAVEENKIFLYPNPVQNDLFIKGLDATKNYSVTITDRTGNVQLTRRVVNLKEAKFNLQRLNANTYYITIISGKSKFELQFLKQ